MPCWSGSRHAFPDEKRISAWRDTDARPLQDSSSVEDNGLAQLSGYKANDKVPPVHPCVGNTTRTHDRGHL
eukprot:2136432-Amphidinium_carterae.3